MPAAVVAIGAMVAGAGAAAAATGAVIGGITIGAVGAAVIGGVTTMAVSYIGNSLFAPDVETTQISIEAFNQGLLLNKASTTSPIPVIYGSRRIGGNRVFLEVSGENNEYVHLVLALCEGPISAINTVYLNDVPSTDTRFSGLVDVYKHLGTDDQIADANLMTAVPSWTAEHRLCGVAYLYIRLKWDSDVFSGGLPTITADIDGRLIYDPRDAITKFSRNPALCIRDYITNTRYGRGIPESQIQDSDVIAAANYCDETVTVGGIVQARYTCDGAINIDDSALTNTERLLSCCRGMLVFSAGYYRLLIDRPAVSTFSFTEDNITGSWQITLGSKKNMFNRLRVRIFNPDRSWQDDIIPIDSEALRVLDNGLILETSIDLPFTAQAGTARQIGAINLNQSRQQIVCQFTAFIEGLRCEVGDVVSITHSTPGWDGKLFRVLGIQLKNDDEVIVSAREYDETVYNFDVISAEDATPNTNLPNLSSVGCPTNLQIYQDFYDTGVYLQSQVVLSWTPPNDAFVLWYEVEYKEYSVGTWSHFTTTRSNFAVLTDLSPGYYDFRVRAINTMMIASDWAMLSGASVTKSPLPQPPIGFQAYLSGQSIVLTWTASSDVSIKGYNIYLGGTAIVTNYNGNRYVYVGNLTAGIYNFTLKTLDVYGQESTTAKSASITIQSPSTPVPSAYTEGEIAIVTWGSCQTSLAIDHYAVNSVSVGNSTCYTERIVWTSKQFNVVAVDVAGNESAAGTVTLNVSFPTAVTQITTTSFPYAIRLTLVYTTFPNFDVIEIWASETNNRDDAELVGESQATSWAHNGLPLIATRYYWTRIRDIYGNYGAWYPESAIAGVMGTTSTDPADYLQVLNGNISEDQLVNDLLTRIDKIDKDYIYEHGVFLSTTPFDMVFSGIDKIIDGTFSDVEQHKIDITNLVVSSNKAANDIAVLESEISALTTTPWSNSASYAVGNYVLHNSKVWRCIKAYTPPPAQEPGLALDYWEESNSLATVVATIDTRVDELEGEIVTKAATITVDQLINRVTAAESSILQNASDILLRVEQTEFDAFSQLFLPEFSTTEFYAVNDYVKYNNTAYRCIKTIDFSPAPLPTNTEYWEISPFADKFSSIINQVELNEEGISLTSSAIIGSVTYLIDTTANRSYETGVFVESISDVQDIDVRITQAGIDIDGAKSQINLLATQISGLDGRVSQAEVDIDGAQANILLKASQVEVDSLSNRMSTAELDIDGAEAAIALKASQTEVDSLSNRMSTAESDIVLNKDNISLTSSSITGPITFLTDTESRSYETGVFIESISDIKDVDIRITQAGIDIDGAEAKINLLTSYVDGLSGHLSQAEIDIDAAQADILLKASQVEVDGLSSRVSQAEIDIDAGQAGSWASISSRVMTATYEEDQKDSDGYLRIAAAENRLAVYDTSNAPVWNATTTYYPGSIVLLTGTYYRCILQSYNNQPPNATYWTPISAGLLSQWTVKLNANGRVAGVGLMLDDSGSSEFIVLSNKFQVVNPTDTMTPKAVFTVGNINGVSAVGVAGDMIIDGSILARHIATNQLTVGDNVAMGPNAYISWSNVTGRPNTTYIDANGIYTGTIVASQINAGTISSDRIAAGSISASKLSFSSLSGLNAYEGSKLAGIAVGADVTLSAINGGLTVTGGGITLSSGGAIKGGQTNYATGTGWFLGYSGGYKLSIGNPSAAHLHWDGSKLEVSRMAVTNPDVVATGYFSCSIAQFGTVYINTGFKELVDHWSTVSNNSYVARAIATSGYINTSHDIARWFLTTTLAQIVGLGPGASGVVWQGQTWYQYEIGILIDVQSINFLVGDSISKINWALMKV